MRPRRRCSCDRPHLPRRRARVGGLCGFRGTAERVPTGSLKTGHCADVWECPAELQHRSRSACGRLSAEREAASGEAGESQGVVRAPWQTHLPAVRAVWGFRAGVVERAKTAPLGSEAQIVPPFQEKQRGCAQNWREIGMANKKIKFPLWLMPETKATVEQNVCNHILASDTDIDAQTYQQMRGKSYQEVLRTNGQISFPEVLRQHSRW